MHLRLLFLLRIRETRKEEFKETISDKDDKAATVDSHGHHCGRCGVHARISLHIAIGGRLLSLRVGAISTA